MPFDTSWLFFVFNIYCLFIWLHRVLVVAHGVVTASCGIFLGCMGSLIAARGPRLPRLSSCGMRAVAHGIFFNQGSNLCSLRWWVDSQPLDHQGRPSNSWLFAVSPPPHLQPPATLHLLSVSVALPFLDTSCNGII